MTFEEAIRFDGRLKIITTNGTCKIGYIRKLDNDNQTIIFKAADDEYSFTKNELSSIEKV